MVTGSRIQAHSSNWGRRAHVTKVLIGMKLFNIIAMPALCFCLLIPPAALAQAAPEKPAEALYLQLGQVKLDPARVYKVRDASLDRSSIHISLEDGTIAFTQDVMGHITGAFFAGDGEILLAPPTEVERRSMSLFTGMAILEEHFATAYFRFNDDAATQLGPNLRALEEKQEFVSSWGAAAENLAQTDAMRLLVTFARMLPGRDGSAPQDPNLLGRMQDRFFHARLQGTKRGVFDVYFDSLAAEQVEAGQMRPSGSLMYYDVWTSFAPDESRRKLKDVNGNLGPGNPSPREDWIAAQQYNIQVEVEPPKAIRARARVELRVNEGGTRAVLFELSRFLQVNSVTIAGKNVEFIHNPAMEGTQLSRRGNDVVAVILPEPAPAGQIITMEFDYGGEVLAEAGNGLLYVGARGTWYPNRGLAMANFDLEFNYPAGWTLVATGKPSPASAPKSQSNQTSRWVSERPIPVAGFNLGRYKEATVQAGTVPVETYATQGVERSFPTPRIEAVAPEVPGQLPTPIRPPKVIVPSQPSPTQNQARVGEAAARAIEYYSQHFGPYPYSHLALTQMPGNESQGWPSLIFLSSYAFLSNEERVQLNFSPDRILLQQMIPAHETAHQWWGDLVTWSTYRDQWISEGLAHYCALMILEEKNPRGFREIMDKYRLDLLEKNHDGISPAEVGPVTLGTRLLSSRLPEGYESITYGRGTWLFHMLRSMLKDAADERAQQGRAHDASEEPFVIALRKIVQRYRGKSVSTREMVDIFAEDLPPSLRYEGKSSLDWFLNGWINGTSLPKLELKSVKLTAKGAGLFVSGTILQKDAPQDLVTSVPVYGLLPGKQLVLLGRVFADGEETSFHVSAPAGTRKILLDPNDTILTAPK